MKFKQVLIITFFPLFVFNISFNQNVLKSRVFNNKIVVTAVVEEKRSIIACKGYKTIEEYNNITEETVFESDKNLKQEEAEVEVEEKDNSITIPYVCTNAEITVGSTQQSVDMYDICLMTEAAASFGEGKPVLLGGHNTKSLRLLSKACIDDIITVNYNGVCYKYAITYSNECSNDGYKLYDIKTGVNMLDYNLNQEVLYIYTCYGNNNWLVKASKI